MDIVTADLLEVEAIQGKKRHKILVICNYFTMVIFPYDLESFTAVALIRRFKEFLGMTGLITRILVVDNASIFNNSDLLTFLSLFGDQKDAE